MEEPTQEEKKYFEDNFKWTKFELYICRVCNNFQTPLPYDMFRHYLSHQRLKENSLELLASPMREK